jgi:hypothetical protein
VTLRGAVTSVRYGRLQRRGHEPAESLEDGVGLQLGEGGCRSALKSWPWTLILKRTAGPGSHVSVREDSGAPRGASRNTRLGGTTAQSVLDARGVSIDRESLRPISKHRQVYSAQRGYAVVPDVLIEAGALFGRDPGRATSSLCFASIRVGSSLVAADMAWPSSELRICVDSLRKRRGWEAPHAHGSTAPGRQAATNGRTAKAFSENLCTMPRLKCAVARQLQRLVGRP